MFENEKAQSALRQQYPTISALQGQAGMATDKPMDRNLQITQEIDNLERELSFQNEQIAILGQRLAPVMSLEPSTDNKAVKENEPTCPMANMLKHVNDRLRDQNRLLSSYLRSLEI